MGLKLDYQPGQTPLNEDETRGLRIRTITTYGELDEFEQQNIESAVQWILEHKLGKQTILSEKFIKSIHKRMLGKVWSWAGEFRRSEKNLGIEWIRIPVELRTLLDDTSYWIDNDSYPPHEIAIRFKHRLVSIHCFPNGNGRHSRIMADIIISSVFFEEIFSWNNSNMVRADDVRKNYIRALREADNGNIKPLIDFARK